MIQAQQESILFGASFFGVSCDEVTVLETAGFSTSN